MNKSQSISLGFLDEGLNELKVENITGFIEFLIPRYTYQPRINSSTQKFNVLPVFYNASNLYLTENKPLVVIQFKLENSLRYALNVKISPDKNITNTSYVVYLKFNTSDSKQLINDYDHKRYFCRSGKSDVIDLIFYLK